MTPNEILRDFRTKYLNTYVWTKLPDSGKEVLCHVDAIQESRDRQAVLQLSSLEYGKLVLNFASNHELRFRFPNVGSFQHGPDSLVIQRRAPHRQYQRGLGAANHTIVTCTSSLTADILPGVQMTLEVMQSAFKQEKFRAREALPLLSKMKVRSVALEGMYSMSQPLDAIDQYMVFCGTTCIGRADEKLKFSPYKGADIYQDEVQRILLEV